MVRQFINLPDACAYLFLFVLIFYCLSATAVVLKLIVTVMNDTIIHRIHCATAFSMQSCAESAYGWYADSAQLCILNAAA